MHHFVNLFITFNMSKCDINARQTASELNFINFFRTTFYTAFKIYVLYKSCENIKTVQKILDNSKL